jgi:RNA polymerase sigma-70 factor (ECF subfamily)
MSGEDYLVSRARSGDREALARLVESHYDMMYRVALRWTKDPDVASDVVQDSCIKVINKITLFRGESRFSSWLSAIIMNTARLNFRKAKRFVSFPDSLADRQECAKPNPETRTQGRQALDQVMNQLRSGREGDYQLVMRRCLVGQSVDHISRETGLSVPTVKVRVHRARARLRKTLEHG